MFRVLFIDDQHVVILGAALHAYALYDVCVFESFLSAIRYALTRISLSSMLKQAADLTDFQITCGCVF